MRSGPTLTVCAYLVIAAAPGLAASPAFLKLGGVDGESTKSKHGHKDEIEILSWSWGEAHSADALTDGLLIVRHAEPGEAAKVSKVEGIAIKQTVARNSGEKGGTEDINIGVGELQEGTARLPGKRTPPTVTLKRGSTAAAAGGVSVAAGDVNGDGRADAAKFGAVSGVRRDDNLAPSKVEKRQHGWVTVSKPLDRGAVRVKVKTPWLGCAVGTRYPALTLGGGAERYQLTDAIISDCAGDSVSFNYAKVKVRGWNPETKEE